MLVESKSIYFLKQIVFLKIRLILDYMGLSVNNRCLLSIIENLCPLLNDKAWNKLELFSRNSEEQKEIKLLFLTDKDNSTLLIC